MSFLTGPDNVRHLYPTRRGGKTWYIDNKDPNSDPDVIYMGDLKSLKVVDEDIDGCKIYEPNDEEDFYLGVIAKGGLGDPPGGCQMDFTEILARRYMFSENDWGPSIEMTWYVDLSRAKSDNNRLWLMGPTSKFALKGKKCCQAATYGVGLGVDKPVESEFLKRMFHKKGDNLIDPVVDEENLDFEVVDLEHPFGIKYVIFLDDGANRRNVRIEHYADFDGNKTSYIKLQDKVDSGGWGERPKGGDVCGGAVDQILNWKGPVMWYHCDFRSARSNNSKNMQMKCLSVREVTSGSDINPVDVGGGFIGPGLTPQTGVEKTFEFRRIYPLIYNMGFFELNECGFQEDTTLATKYEVDDDGNFFLLSQSRHRVCQYIATTQSKYIGMSFAEITVYLERVGSAPPGSIDVTIVRGLDDEEVVSFTPTGGPISADTYPATKTAETFQNLTNNYFLQPFDKICVSYTGGDNDVDGIKVYINTSDPEDSSNSCIINFDVVDITNTPIAYSSPVLTSDLAAIMKVKESTPGT